MGRRNTYLILKGRAIRGPRQVLCAFAIAALLAFPAGSLAKDPPKSHRKVLVMVPPELPDILKKGRYEGTVRLAATVSPDGSVSRVEVLGGNPMLARYASEAVMRWKYVPLGAGTVENVNFDFSPTVH